MNCEGVRKTLSAFLDRKLGRDASDYVSQHLAGCRDCSTYAEELRETRSFLRSLPMLAAPAWLQTQLQVMASRERVRRLSHNTVSALLHYWWEEMRLYVDNLMRPIAIPLAGGLVSAVFLFSMLMPTLQFHHHTWNDVPSGLFTQSEASMDTVPPFGFSEDNVEIQVTLDETGAVVDYVIPKGNDTPQLRNDIANMILFTTFKPATEYGIPRASKVMVSFRRIVVRG
jgi:putative zinc finger protein